MPETPGTSKQEIKLFYCYAHEDKALRDELQINLAGLRRQYHLTNWYDREILPGEPWEEAIDKHLSTADVILLLISPHFVDSDYCYSKEMQRALERHHAGSCCVIPILLRPTYWEDTPIRTIQMLPTDAKPITSWPDRYEAFHDVAKGISTAIKALLTARSRATEVDLLKKGKALHVLGRYEEALDAYKQALLLAPDFADAYYYKGSTLQVIERSKEAQQAFEKARQLGYSSWQADIVLTSTNRPEIFISYSYKDRRLREKLEKYLSKLKVQFYRTTWHDRRIGTGIDWVSEINTHLNTASIILLLVSPDFLASDYCFSIEVKRAMERHERGEARVIPIILRPVFLKSTLLEKLKALPTGARPISTWINLEEAFWDVAKGIEKVIDSINLNER